MPEATQASYHHRGRPFWWPAGADWDWHGVGLAVVPPPRIGIPASLVPNLMPSKPETVPESSVDLGGGSGPKSLGTEPTKAGILPGIRLSVSSALPPPEC